MYIHTDTNRVACGKTCVEVGESEKKFSRPEKILRKFKTKKYDEDQCTEVRSKKLAELHAVSTVSYNVTQDGPKPLTSRVLLPWPPLYLEPQLYDIMPSSLNTENMANLINSD